MPEVGSEFALDLGDRSPTDLSKNDLSKNDRDKSHSSQSPRCWLIIGIPGSGKTTFARKLLRSQPHTQLVSSDLIRARLYSSPEVQGDWQEIWRQVESEFRDAYNLQQSVIYDATNCQRSHRIEAIALAQSCGFRPIIGLWLRDPLWICLMRNQTRDRQVPEERIIAMHRSLQIEPPSLREGFDSLIYPKESQESEWID
jgi:predicted kinase